ncbi:MAG: 4-hydroxythreonine-4-phosphate dehydrogenase PdxA, partial [Pantoea sp. Brub]|nr:4-hydroxythreonine-4-phosphate dehydrogenase PdxA [Pantoea sp. Brub]
NQLNLPLNLFNYRSDINAKPQQAGTLTILPIELNKSVIPGNLCADNSIYVINTLIRSCNGCTKGEFNALVTGPINKGIINQAGIRFTGHTEFFSKHTKSDCVVMMFVFKKLRVALATTHIPLKYVTQSITHNKLYKIISILYVNLQKYFCITKPCIYVCSINPHAGENGYIGKEEINIMIPVLDKFKKQGINVIGPLASDTLFQKKNLQKADAILTMYHDQGLPVLKFQAFNKSVNVSLGLPFIRTSVDHGTGLELAASGQARAESFIKAIQLAINMIKSRNEQL